MKSGEDGKSKAPIMALQYVRNMRGKGKTGKMWGKWVYIVCVMGPAEGLLSGEMCWPTAC